MKKIIYLFLISEVVLFKLSSIVFAQKLPNKQQISVRAPNNIKIDGKATEWNDSFQAFNTADLVYYTISNDNDNLYITIKAVYQDVVRRIINGGISLTVISTNTKETGMIRVTYPIPESSSRMYVTFYNLKREGLKMIKDTSNMDSLMKINNERISNRSKSIKVEGIKHVDSLISIYNDVNIKAAATFDSKLNYTYELAIPLEYIKASIKNYNSLKYQVRINDVQEQGISRTYDPTGKLKRITMMPGSHIEQPATDFWGEYILMK